MEVVFDNNRVRKRCGDARGKLKQRLDDMLAADSMAVLETLPGHYHALTADRAGQWACSLEEPYRLVFLPVGNPLPVSKDGRLDTTRVTAVRIVEVVNYHERKNKK
ncbi:MAG TPA: killer suppression protein HigA [Spirochaetia bacterium]